MGNRGWQGCDSILAAPLVLDMVRFTELARRRGETGLMTFLASFFKSPYGVIEQQFDKQFRMLEDWARSNEKRCNARDSHGEVCHEARVVRSHMDARGTSQ